MLYWADRPAEVSFQGSSGGGHGERDGTDARKLRHSESVGLQRDAVSGDGQARSSGPSVKRLWLPAAAFGIAALVLVGRLVQLQVVDHAQYAKAASNELLAEATRYPLRGTILDRHGNVLALSESTWDIYANSQVWGSGGEAVSSSRRLGKLIGTNAATLRQTVAREATQQGAIQVLVKRSVPYGIGESLATNPIAGVVAMPDSVRLHPNGDLASTILGMTGVDGGGLNGIELEANALLQGQPGDYVYQQDAVGDPIPFTESVMKPPTQPSDVQLTIDPYIQQMAEQRLAAAIKQHQASGGQVIVMDPMTGEILALASDPGMKYSTLNLSNASSVALLNNVAVTNQYEPGSEFKLITTSAAINTGKVTPNTTYVDTGFANIDGVVIHNWQYNVYGTQTMTGVLVNSINTGAIFMAERLGPKLFYQYVKAFGFGRPTGIDLPGDASGYVRKPGDPGWLPVNLATEAFGQGIAVTPIQLITAVSAVVNGGTLLQPHLIKATISPDGVVTPVRPKVVGHPITAQTSAELRQMMHAVLSISPARPLDYRAGGKSSTANEPLVTGGYNHQTQDASFVEFAPLNNPRIVVLVTLDHNKDLATGTMAAGPIAGNLVDGILQYLSVPSDLAAKASKG